MSGAFGAWLGRSGDEEALATRQAAKVTTPAIGDFMGTPYDLGWPTSSLRLRYGLLSPFRSLNRDERVPCPAVRRRAPPIAIPSIDVEGRVLSPAIDSTPIDKELRPVRASGHLQEFVVFGTHSAGHDQEFHYRSFGPARVGRCRSSCTSPLSQCRCRFAYDRPMKTRRQAAFRRACVLRRHRRPRLQENLPRPSGHGRPRQTRLPRDRRRQVGLGASAASRAREGQRQRERRTRRGRVQHARAATFATSTATTAIRRRSPR